jgi:hypothetical protein
MLYLETAIIKNLRIISSVSVLELNATVLHENVTCIHHIYMSIQRVSNNTVHCN